jgi:hypothetical protein
VGGSLLPTANFEYAVRYEDATSRRSLYLPVNRSDLLPYLQLFDYPDPHVTTGQRATTTVPTQALFLLNNSFVQNNSAHLGLKARTAEADEDERVNWINQHVLLREATDDEVKSALEFIKLSQETPGVDGWQSFCHALLMCSEFCWTD